MKKVAIWLTILVTLLVSLIALLGLFAWRDTQIADSSKVYEDCVGQRYHMTPANYYQLTGFYPECKK